MKNFYKKLNLNSSVIFQKIYLDCNEAANKKFTDCLKMLYYINLINDFGEDDSQKYYYMSNLTQGNCSNVIVPFFNLMFKTAKRKWGEYNDHENLL